MILTYKYRLLPTKRQHRALEELLESQRQLYNAALEERLSFYKVMKKGLSFNDQCKALTECRNELPEMARLPLKVQRWTLGRLDLTFKKFFLKLYQNKGRGGFPRFRSETQWKSFGFRQFNNCICLRGHWLKIWNFPGELCVHLHRPLPKSQDIRACIFKRDSKGWCIHFQVNVLECRKKNTITAVGIDLGLKVFSYASDGVIIPNPQIAKKAEKELRRRQRALARCKRGSKRRNKVKSKLTKFHKQILNTRKTWLHQQSRALVNRTDLIVAEDLNVSAMIQRYPSVAKFIHNVSWASFLSMVAYKAERAGKHFIKVDPRNTSQKCSSCQELVPKSLAVRTHSCPHCGLTIDRDWNAARNILQAVVGLGADNVVQWGERRLGNISPG